MPMNINKMLLYLNTLRSLLGVPISSYCHEAPVIIAINSDERYREPADLRCSWLTGVQFHIGNASIYMYSVLKRAFSFVFSMTMLRFHSRIW